MIYLCTITEPVEGKSGTYCPTCKRILPDAHFKRLLTPAQARARGFPREGERVYEHWKQCRKCAPSAKRTPVRFMKPKALIKAVEQGVARVPDLPSALVLAQQREDARILKAKREGVLRRWDTWWAARWDYARDRLRKELEKTTQRIYYSRDTPHEDDPHRLVVTFLLKYRQELRSLISWFTRMRGMRALGRAHARAVEASEAIDTGWGERRRGRPPKTKPTGDRQYVMDQHSQWADYIRVQTLHALREEFLSLPTQARIYRLGNPPLLLLSDNPTQTQCLHGYPEFADRDASRQRMAALKG